MPNACQNKKPLKILTIIRNITPKIMNVVIVTDEKCLPCPLAVLPNESRAKVYYCRESESNSCENCALPGN